jgi:hypothetical protein
MVEREMVVVGDVVDGVVYAAEMAVCGRKRWYLCYTVCVLVTATSVVFSDRHWPVR